LFFNQQALNEGMEVLNLRWNCIRGKGGVAIANALSVSFCFFPLYLSGNKIVSYIFQKFGRNSVPLPYKISNARI